MTDLPGFSLDDVSFTEDKEPSSEGPPRTRQRKKRSDAGQPRTPRTGGTSARGQAKLAEDLLEPWAMLAKGIAFTMPTVSAVMLARGEKTTAALVGIAANHPKMLKALQNVGKVGPGVEIGETLVMILVASQVDMGRIPPQHPIASALGVSALHAEIYGHMVVPGETIDSESYAVPPPPRMTGDPTDINNPVYSFKAGPK